jgi:hypothetical protein
MQWSAPLSDGQILGVMSDQGRGLLRGCYFGEQTQHAVLDIDAGSQYHTGEALTKLLQEFSLLGLNLVPYRSSESGGWHLYCYFDSAVRSQEVEVTIKSYLLARGYQIKSGTLEIFPSGNALRLPLQPGFGWLDPDGNLEVSREELTEGQALVLLFNDIEENKRNWSEAKSRIETEISKAAEAAGAGVQEHEKAVSVQGFDQLFQKGLDLEKWERGRQYWALGLTSKSQRHDAIHCVGHYRWYGDEEAGLKALPGQRNKALRAAEIEAWLREKHNGLSEDISRGRHREVSGDIERAVSWSRQTALVSEYEPYRVTDRMIDRLMAVPYLTPEDLRLANDRRESRARTKIREALAEMLTKGEHPTIKKLAKATGCRKETVRRHLDIWRIYAVHPSTLGMSKGLGDYIAGGLGGTPTSLRLSCSEGSCSEEEKRFTPSSVAGGVVEFLPQVQDGGLAEALDHGLISSEGSVSRPVTESLEPLSDSGFLELDGAGPLNFSVAPLFHGWQGSQPESAQSQAQALRVPTASLTPGPVLSGIQPLRHVTAGGILLFPERRPVWYADATKYGIEAEAGASSKRGALVAFGGGEEANNTVLDATNYKFLTTRKNGFRSGKKDKISLIGGGAKVRNLPVSVPGRSLAGAAVSSLPLPVSNAYVDGARLSGHLQTLKPAELLTSRPYTFDTVSRRHGVDSSSMTITGLCTNLRCPVCCWWLTCRQQLYNLLSHYGLHVGHGPPTCIQHILSRILK